MFRSYKNKIEGISLIEMSMFIAVSGFLIVAGVQMSHLKTVNAKQEQTTSRLASAKEALDTYYLKNQRLPCPAPRNAAMGTDDTYGKAVDISNTKRPDPDDEYDQDVYDCEAGGTTGVITAPGGLVQIGALPVRDLGLPEGSDLDAFGNRLVYAVTANYTTSEAANTVEGAPVATSMSEGGGIRIEDSSTRSATSASGAGSSNVVFAVVAPGSDGRGAYNAQGKLVQDCDASGTAKENCDGDSVFVATTITKENMGTDSFSAKVAYRAGGGIPPEAPSSNQACAGNGDIGDILFILDTSSSTENQIAFERQGKIADNVSRFEVIHRALKDVLPTLYNQRAADLQKAIDEGRPAPPRRIGFMEIDDLAGDQTIVKTAATGPLHVGSNAVSAKCSQRNNANLYNKWKGTRTRWFENDIAAMRECAFQDHTGWNAAQAAPVNPDVNPAGNLTPADMTNALDYVKNNYLGELRYTGRPTGGGNVQDWGSNPNGDSYAHATYTTGQIAIRPTGRPLYEKIVTGAATLGNGKTVNGIDYTNMIVVLAEGPDKGSNQTIKGSRAGMVMALDGGKDARVYTPWPDPTVSKSGTTPIYPEPGKYDHLRVAFVSVGNNATLGSYFTDVTKRKDRVSYNYKMEGTYEPAMNLTDYVEALKRATICPPKAP